MSKNEQNQSRKIFRLIILSTARNGFFLLSGCHESLVLYFFSFPAVEKQFPPDDEQILKKPNSIRYVFFKNSNRQIVISRFSVVKSSCNKC